MSPRWGSKPLITIVTVNYNGWDDTRLCLQSLSQLTVPAQVVLVDNGSRDDRCDEFRKEFPQVQVIRNAVNGGWAGGNNTGILSGVCNRARTKSFCSITTRSFRPNSSSRCWPRPMAIPTSAFSAQSSVSWTTPTQ